MKKYKTFTVNQGLRNHALIYTLPIPERLSIGVWTFMFMATLGARSYGILMQFVKNKASSSDCAIVPNKRVEGIEKSKIMNFPGRLKTT